MDVSCRKLSATEHIFQTAYVLIMKTRVFLYILIQVLIPQELVASTCRVLQGACLINDARALSTKILHAAKRDLSPMSCLTFCATKENCIGMNEKNDSDICQFLEEDDIIPGLEWYYNSLGYKFWSFEQKCPKVWYFVMYPEIFVICLMEDNVTTKANGLWITLVINKSLVA